MNRVVLLPRRYSKIREKAIGECNGCGLCIETCPAIRVSALADEEPKKIAESALAVFRGEPVSEMAFQKAFACVRCGACWKSCPQGLNPYILGVILRAEMFAQGKSPYDKETGHEELPPMKINNALITLQMRPEERDWLTKSDEHPKPKEFVVFLGCSFLGHSGMIRTLFAILNNMEINYVALGGGDLCCGGPAEAKGKITEAEDQQKELIEAILVYRPKKVIFICPTCYFKFTKALQECSEVTFQSDIDVLHVSQFIADNLNKLKFTKELNKTVVLFDPCKLGKVCEEYEAPRKVLRALPGVKLIEMPGLKKDSCCGGGSRYFPEVANNIQRQAMHQLQKSGAEVVITLCSFCHINFIKMSDDYSFKPTLFLDFIGEAMGLNNEDKVQKYMKYHDPDRVLKEASFYIEANSLNKEELNYLRYLIGILMP